MNIDEFSHEIKAWRSQLMQLLQSTDKSESSFKQALLKETFQELHTALEELMVAEEELRQQNEELLIAQIAVKSEHQRYQDLFEFAPDGYLLTDPRGMIREVNRAAATLLNVSQKFLISKPLVNFILLEERSNFRSKLSQLQKKERLPAWEVRIQPRHADPVDIEVTIAAIRDRAGQLVALRWLLRDITERKQAELERAQLLMREQAARKEAGQLLEQLTQANRLKDEFLAIVSHELRSPLSTILGWAQMLRSTPLDSSLTIRAGEVIEQSAKAQTQLIQDLLDVSQIITGKLRMQVYSIELTPIIKAAIEIVRLAADAKQIQIKLILEPKGEKVLGNPERLQQVIWNLLSNAIKFTPERGLVEAQLKFIDSQAEIIVSDSGIGIKSEFLPFVFERFRQADSTITRSYNGMGLGLAITRHLVELHGGTIQVDSPGEGQGTTFRVRLPLIS
jgi:PAS domain S-box-containing protein